MISPGPAVPPWVFVLGSEGFGVRRVRVVGSQEIEV